jgi:hypothetical protein
LGEEFAVRAVRLHPPGRIEDLRLDEVESPEPVIQATEVVPPSGMREDQINPPNPKSVTGPEEALHD